MSFEVRRIAPIVATMMLILIVWMPVRPLPLAFEARLIAHSASQLALPQWPVRAPASTPPLPAADRLRLIGTFLQPRLDQRWTGDALRDLFLDFRRLGLSRVVVQWTVAGTRAFYPSATFQPVPDPPLEPLLELADEFGISVRLGLAHDPAFWENTRLQKPPGDIEAYLQLQRSRSINVLRELQPIAIRHRSFDGWFLTEEIDDVNWLSPERRALLHAYFKDLRQTVRLQGPQATVAVSGFSNAYCDPATLEAFWRELLAETGVDLVYFQDGIGVHKLELPHLAMYLDAMRRAALGAGHDLSVVVEVFDQVGGPPVSEGSFRAVPAGIDRIVRQLALAAAASTSGIFAFSVPDYMTPAAGPAARQLFDDYAARASTVNTAPAEEKDHARP
jgi:hypothetical protein